MVRMVFIFIVGSCPANWSLVKNLVSNLALPEITILRFVLLYSHEYTHMEVRNIHTRIIDAPCSEVARLLDRLSSKDDPIWPREHWPAMKLDSGLQAGSKGGHGPIGYFVKEYVPGRKIVFQFTRPSGFNGIHELELKPYRTPQKSMIEHRILMNTTGLGTFNWLFAIRWLHDALIEDAFDKLENQFADQKTKTSWNLWVRILRYILK